MYLLTVDEILGTLSSSNRLSMPALAAISSADSELGEQLIVKLTDMFLEEASSEEEQIYETPLAMALSVVKAASGRYFEAVNKLIDAGEIKPFIVSVMSQPFIPQEVMARLIPLAAEHTPHSFFSQGVVLSESDIDLFVEAYINKVLESEESIKEWVDTLGFEVMHGELIRNSASSDDAKMKFQQLFLMWRSK